MTDSIFGPNTTFCVDGLAIAALILLGIPALRAVWFVMEGLLDWIRMGLFYSSPNSLKGKVVWVVGASSGIGKAAALRFAAHGASVVLSSRRRPVLEDVAEACRSKQSPLVKDDAKIVVLPCDCSDGSAVDLAFEQLKSQVGIPDIVIASSGTGAWRYLHTQSPADVEAGVKAPFMATAQQCRAILPDMLANKERKFSILILTGPAPYFSWPGCTMYTANRSGLRGLYQALSQDLHGTNVRIVPMMFGETNTGYWDANPGSRQFVPWISNFIPNLSTTYCAKKMILAAALGKNRLMIYNWQVALLIWANSLFPSLMLFSMRLFRKPMPLVGTHRGEGGD